MSVALPCLYQKKHIILCNYRDYIENCNTPSIAPHCGLNINIGIVVDSIIFIFVSDWIAVKWNIMYDDRRWQMSMSIEPSADPILMGKDDVGHVGRKPLMIWFQGRGSVFLSSQFKQRYMMGEHNRGTTSLIQFPGNEIAIVLMQLIV